MNKRVSGIILSIIFVTGTFATMKPLPVAEAHDSGWHDYCFDQTLNAFLNIIQFLIDFVKDLGIFGKWLQPFILFLAVLAGLAGYFLSWSCPPALVPPSKMITETFQGFECNDVGRLTFAKTSDDSLSGGFSSNALFFNRATPQVTYTDTDGNPVIQDFPKIQNVFLFFPLIFFWLPTIFDLFLDNIKIAKKVKFLAKLLNLFFGLILGFLDYNFQAKRSAAVNGTKAKEYRDGGDAYTLHPALGISKAGITGIGTSFVLGKNEVQYFSTSAAVGKTDTAPFRFNVFDNEPPEIFLPKNVTLEANTRFGFNIDLQKVREQLGGVTAEDNCSNPIPVYHGKDYYLLTALAGTQSAEWTARDNGYHIWDIPDQDKNAAFQSIQNKISSGQAEITEVAVSELGLEGTEGFVTIPQIRALNGLEQYLVDEIGKDELGELRTKLQNKLDQINFDIRTNERQISTGFKELDFDARAADGFRNPTSRQIFIDELAGRGDGPTGQLRIDTASVKIEQLEKQKIRAQRAVDLRNTEFNARVDLDNKFDNSNFGKRFNQLSDKISDVKFKIKSKTFGKFIKLDPETKSISKSSKLFKFSEKISNKVSKCCKKVANVLGATFGAALGPAIGAAITGASESTPGIPAIRYVQPYIMTSFQEINVIDTIPPDILVTENVALEVQFKDNMALEAIPKKVDVTVPLIFDIADPFPIIEFNVTKPDGLPGVSGIVDDDSVELEFELGVSTISWQATDFSNNPSKIVEQIVNLKKNGTNIVSVAFNQTTPAIFSGDPTEISLNASNTDEDPLDFLIVTIPSNGVILSAFDAIFQNVFQINGTVSRLNGLSHAGQNNTYLTDSSNSRVMLLTTDGNLNIAFNTSKATSNPQAIALNGSDTFLISDWPSKIFKVKDDGFGKVDVLSEFDVDGLFEDPKNIAVDGNTIYITDKQNGTITKLIDQDVFGRAKGIVVDNNDNVLVVDDLNNHTANFTTSGIFSSKFGNTGNNAGEFNEPMGIEVNGIHIFVADTGNDRIQIFNSSGTFKTEIVNSFDVPRDVTINATKIFVADTGNDRIQIFNSSGIFETEIGIDSPHGIVVVDNEIFVADNNNHRINKINLADPFFSDDYSDDTSWGTIGSGVVVNTITGKANFTDVDTGTLAGLNGINRTDLQPLPDNGWIADFDLLTGKNRENSSGFIWLLTNETSHPSSGNTLDALGVYLNSNQLNIYQEHGDTNSTASGINVANNTQYYITFERQSKEQAKLSVFSDTQRTTHITNSPISDVIDENISQLKVLQHTNDNNILEGNLLNLEIDNSTIKPIKFSWLGQCDSGTNCNADAGFKHSIGFMCTEDTCSIPTASSGNGHLKSPTELVFNGTDFFVADSGNHRVQIFNSSGIFEQKIGKMGTENGNFTSPMGLGFDSTGNFYVSDDSSRVQKFDSSGNFLQNWENSINTRFEGFMEVFRVSLSELQIDSITFNNSTRDIYVGDWTPDKERIVKLQPGGSKIISYDISDDVTSPRNLAVNGTNIIYITDSDPTDPRLVLIDGTSGDFLDEFSLTDILFIPNMTNANNKITIIPTGIEITTEIGGPGEHVLVFDNSTEKIIEITNNTQVTGVAADTLFNATTIFSNLQEIAVNATHVFGLDKTSGIETIVNVRWDKGISNINNIPGNSSLIKGITLGKQPKDDNQIFFVNSSNNGIYNLNITSNNIELLINLTDTKVENQLINPESIAINPLPVGLLETFLNGTDGLSAPRDLLFDDGKLYVTNELSNSILFFNDTTGKLLGEIKDEVLQMPKDIAMDVNGTLYVSSHSNNLVLKFNKTTGEFDSVADSRSTLMAPTGLTFGPKGGLYVSNGGLDNILKFNLTTGGFEFFVPSKTMPQLVFPQSLTFGPDENLYVSSKGTNEILHYNGTTGEPLGVFGDANSVNSGLSDPIDLVFSPNGKFLFVSSSKNDAVLQFNGTNGDFLGLFTDTAPTTPQGLAFGLGENLYVANRLLSEILVYGNVTTKFYVSDWNATNNRIIGLSENGTITKIFNNLDLDDPRNIATDTVGDIWITDPGNDFIVNIDRLNGNVLSTINTTSITSSSTPLKEVDLANGTTIFVDENGDIFENATIPIASFKPDGITLDDFDVLHVTNWDRNHVVLLNLAGESRGSVKLNSTVTSPGDITVTVNDEGLYDLFVYDEDIFETGKGGIIQIPIGDTLSQSFLLGKSGPEMKGLEWITDRADHITEFGSAGTDDGEFDEPWGIENTVSRVYVSDRLNNRIQVFDNAGNFRFDFGSSCAIALVGKSNPDVSGCVDPDGGGPLEAGDGQFLGPSGIAIDGIKTYVADALNNRIQVLAPTGAFLDKFGELGSGPGQLRSPVDVAINGTGFVYVADFANHRIQVFDSQGEFLFKFGTKGSNDGQFDLPQGIAIDDGNRVYVADAVNNRIQVFDSQGEFLFKFGTQGSNDGQFDSPNGIDITLDKVYVTDANNRVQVFSLNGDFIFSWGTLGSGESEFNRPAGISIDEITNRVYVVGSVNDRVQVFEPFFASLLFGHSTSGTIITSDLLTNIEVRTDLEIVPDGITVPDSDTIFVTDWRQKRIVQLNDQGDHEAEFDFSFINFADSNKLRDIEYNEQKDFFFVADARKATIPKILPNSIIVDEEQIADKFIHMSGIEVGSDDNFYVTSTEEEVLNKYTERGSLLERAVIDVDLDMGGSMIDIDVRLNATTGEDLIYVLVKEDGNHHIERFNSDLKEKFVIPLTIPPSGIAVDSNSTVYVSNSESATKSVIDIFFSNETNSISSITVPDTVGRLADLVIDSRDSLFAVDEELHRVHRYNLTDDSYVGWLGKCESGPLNICNVNDRIGIGFRCTSTTCSNDLTGENSGNKFGQFFEPKLITVDNFGNFYVADTEFMLPSAQDEFGATLQEIRDSGVNSPRIQKFANNGLFIEKTVSDLTETSFAGNFQDPRGLAVGNNHFYVVDVDKLNVFDVNPFSLVEFNDTTKDSISKVTYESLIDFVGEDRFEWRVDDGFNKSNVAHANVTVMDPDPDDDGIFSSFDFDINGIDSSMQSSNRFLENSTNTTGIIIDEGTQNLLVRNDRDQNKGLFIQSNVTSTFDKRATIRACNNVTEFYMNPGDRVVVTCGGTVQMDVIRGNIFTSFFDSAGRNATGQIFIENSITFEPTDFTFLAGEENRDEIEFDLRFNGKSKVYPVPSNSLVKVDTAKPEFPIICSPSLMLEAESKMGVVGTDDTTTNQFELIQDFLDVNATEIDNGFSILRSTNGDILQADDNSTDVYSYDLSTASVPTKTVIEFTAQDEAGNIASCTSTVFVEDTTKPVLEQLANMTSVETPRHSDLKSVHWEPPVIFDLPDVFGGDKQPVTENVAECTPQSGFEFQISNATVTCIGVDRASETNSTFFTIEVIPNAIGVEIDSVTASSNNTNSVISDGDKIFVKFAQSTNKPPASTKNQIDTLFSLTPTHSLGADYTGRYLNPSVLEINITDSFMSNLITGAGATEFTIKLNANLTSASGLIKSSILPSALQGSFTEKAPPFITAFLVTDTGNSDPTEETTMQEGMGDVVYSVGDTFTIKFSESTNEPKGTTVLDTAKVNEIFEFFPQNIGDKYEGIWKNPSTFLINITRLNTGMGNPDPKIGETQVKVKESIGLKNKLETSISSKAVSQPLTGSFGPYTVLKNVDAGATGSVILPSGINTEISIPGGDPFVTFIPTGEAINSISVLGEFVDIQASNETACDDGCEVTFTFTDDDLNVGLSQLVIFHDVNGDGLFSNATGFAEELIPKINPASPPGPYTASVTIFDLSELGIGVPPPRGGSSSGDKTPPTFNSAFFSGVKTLRDDGTYGFGGILSQEIEFSNSMPTAIVETGKPVKMKLILEDNGGAQALQHISLYTNLRGFSTQISDSDTFVRYNKGKSIQVEDPNGFFKVSDLTISNIAGKIEVIFDMTFAKEMKTSDIFIRVWDIHKNSKDAKFLDAIQVVKSKDDLLDEPDLDKEMIPQDILEKWTGYSNEVISDSEFLKIAGIEGNTIPEWYKKKMSNWIINEIISQQELIDALNFFARTGLLV